jgi:hypothetical protein
MLAQTLMRYMGVSVNVLGFARNVWVEPTFDHYQQVALSFQSLVNQSVQNIVQLIESAASLDLNRQRLQDEATQLINQRPALAADVAAAKAMQAAAAVRLQETQYTLTHDQQLAQTSQEALEQAQMQVEQDGIWTTIGSVFQVVTAVVQAGVAIVTGDPYGVLGGLLNFIPILSGQTSNTVNVSGLTGTLQLATQSNNLTSWLNADGFYNPSQSTLDAIKAASGGITELLNGAAAFLNKELATAQADQAKYNNLQSQYAGLVRQVLNDTFAVSAAHYDNVAANMGVDAATARQAANEASIALLSSESAIDAAGLRALGPAIRALLGTNRVYQDVINRYVFFAARAAEIWTLSDLTDSLRFDTGYIYPDDEERAFFDLEYAATGENDGDATQILYYATQVSSGWTAIPEMTYQYAFDTYNQNLVEATVYVHLTDPALLTQFKDTRAVTFAITADDLPSGCAELKVDQIRMALVGATASNPTFACLLVHGGDAVNTLVDGATEDVHAPPTDPVILATSTAPLAPDAGGFEAVRQQFWGRSPVASWTLSIQSGVITANQVDLSGITEVFLEIQVACKLVAVPVSVGATVLNR